MEQQYRKEEKKILRERMKRMRRSLSAVQVMRLSTQICERLLSMQEVLQAETVLLYAAVRGEADLGYFFRALHTGEALVSGEGSFRKKTGIPGQTLAYPRVRGDQMDFFEIHSVRELVPGAFGIPEPVSDAKLICPVSNSVIFVPGVAFMENGNRIGMGKGYYDRYLAQYPNLLKIGIAYEAQLEAVWEPDEHDLPMDRIVTENQVIHCGAVLAGTCEVE